MVDNLVDALRALERTSGITFVKDDYIARNNPIVLEATDLAERTLITPSGECDWDAIEALQHHGYDAFAVERDGFGWMVGGIVTRVGILTYG